MSPRLRSILAAVLLVLGVVLVPLAVTASWLRTTVTDTDSYVATVTPLATDPAVTALVVKRATDPTMTAITDQKPAHRAIDGLEANGLPPAAGRALGLLVAPLTDQVEQVVRRAVTKVVTSDRFPTAWATANRVAHTQLIDLLSGSSTGALVDNGTSVSIDIGNLVTPIEQRLTAAGVPLVDKLPPITASVPILPSEDVRTARSAYSGLRVGGVALPILALVLLVGGLALARHRRRALVRAGLGVAVGCVLLLLGLALARSRVASGVPPDSSAAAVAITDTVIADLRGLVRVVVAVALAVVLVAVLAGPSRGARQVRSLADGGWSGARSGVDRAAAAPLALPVAAGVGVVCILVVVFAGDLGRGWTITLVAIAAVALLVAVLAGRAESPDEDGEVLDSSSGRGPESVPVGVQGVDKETAEIPVTPGVAGAAPGVAG